MTDFLTDSKEGHDKEPTVVYLEVEKDKIIMEELFNMLFEMTDENNIFPD